VSATFANADKIQRNTLKTMPILRDIPIHLNPEEILASPGRRQVQPDLLSQAEQAIALGQTLWQPVAIYDWFDVQRVDGEHVYLSGEDTLHTSQPSAVLQVGPKADLLDHARRVLVSVITIGPALEQRVQELQAAREGLQSYLLDSAGVVALGSVGEALRCLVEEAAADLGWGVSPSLSPGSLVGWPLRGQRELCALLPIEEIGVQLTNHYVLVPSKSVSGLVGLGPGYESGRVGSVCKYCALQNTCWRRREDPS
jgi:hypothetical protein